MDVMKDFLACTEGSGLRHFFYGGAEGVADALKDSVLQNYPKTEIVGTFCPPFRPLNDYEEACLLAQLQETKPHCIWVGLSTPKQERFMAHFVRKYLDINQYWGHGLTLFGVGAAFDFISGRVKQAPCWIQRSGFEWLYRVYADPKRLWKRYTVNNTKFVFKILLQLVKF